MTLLFQRGNSWEGVLVVTNGDTQALINSPHFRNKHLQNKYQGLFSEQNNQKTVALSSGGETDDK